MAGRAAPGSSSVESLQFWSSVVYLFLLSLSQHASLLFRNVQQVGWDAGLSGRAASLCVFE